MPKLLPAVTLACLALAWAASPARAQGASVAGNGQQQSLDCGGGDAVIRGNDNRISLTGACRSVLLEGNGNRLRAALAGGASVTVRGNDDRIGYQLMGGGQPRVRAAGQNNQIVAEGASAAADATPANPPLALREENQQRDLDCAGRDVLVEGNGDQYTLHGGCRSLTIRGEGVLVHAEMAPGSSIGVEGNGDQVDWFLHRPGPDPTTSIRGEGSRIYQQHRLGSIIAPPTSPSPQGSSAPSPLAPALPAPAVPAITPVRPDLGPPLAITATDESRDANCAGRDVTLNGANAIVVLRGGCRSLTVEGDGNRVQAEMMPGTRITIVGSKSTVAFALVGTGPDPIVSANGQGSNAWRVQRLGAVSRADASTGVTPTPQGMVVQGGQGAVVSQMPEVHQPLHDSGPPGIPGDQPAAPPPAGAGRGQAPRGN